MTNTVKNLIYSASTAILFILVSYAAAPAIAHANYGYDSYNGGYNSYSSSYYNPSTSYANPQTSYANYSAGYNGYAARPASQIMFAAPITYPVYQPVYQYPPVIQTYPVYQPVAVQVPVIVPVPVQVPVVVQVPVIVPVPVQVAVPQYQAYPVNSNRGLDIGCYVDPTNASINQPINWSVEVTGGIGPYTYSWTGSDGLTGNQSSVVKFYSTSGEKSAIVYVTSADGRTGTRACSNVITIRKPYVAPKVVVKAPVVQTQPISACDECAREQAALKASTQKTQSESLTANVPTTALSAFSLSYVPWGWVALLVILVLFATVMYLLFNRPKI